MEGLLVLLLTVLSLLQPSQQTERFTGGKDICRLLADGTEVRKPGYCNQSIKCQNHVSTPGQTCADGKYFGLSKKTCGTKDKTDTYCNVPCTTKSKGYIGDSFNCANWYYCDKATALSSGICGNGMYFDKAKQMCVYPQDTTCAATYELCQVVPADIKIKDEHNCHQYITCKSSKPTVNDCGTGMYYDVDLAKCEKKALVKCESHPIPDGACGTKKLAKRNAFSSDGATCRGYYYCRDLGSGVPDPDPLWQQCPLEYFFEPTAEVCLDRSLVKCAEDRCDGRMDGFELVQNSDCRKYIECKNGVEFGDILECPENMWFDYGAQACTREKTTYRACL
ncbi:CG5883 [Drosophila busckii]|uniref:CG5883 n=1 Tax=Drosophila busckii TaxID=30019 RepID=A0A0M5J625_DROBS|nr:peritrophin-44 [Drosophila busckii]ALC44381.1 CG5883 [Drosophila busckii]